MVCKLTYFFEKMEKFVVEKIKTNGKGKGLSFEFSILFKP